VDGTVRDLGFHHPLPIDGVTVGKLELTIHAAVSSSNGSVHHIQVLTIESRIDPINHSMSGYISQSIYIILT